MSSREEALRRYNAVEDYGSENIDEFEFEDEFMVYDAWG